MPKMPPDNPQDFEVCEFWAENVPMTLDGIKGKVFQSKVEGAAVQKEYQEFIESISEYYFRKRHLKEKSLTGKINLTKQEKDELRKQYLAVRQTLIDKREEFIYQHSNYYFAGQELISTITNFPNDVNRGKMKVFFDAMPANLKSDIYGTQLNAFLKTKPSKEFLPLKIGDIPHDFILPNSKEEEVSFSKVKGKIILLDFWASGCGPCRIEHKNYVELYSKYKSKGFEIVSVSLDRSKKRWVKAMTKDNMTWTSLLDVDWDLSKKQYLVNSLPTNFLIDEKGVIVAKDVRGDNLKQELEKQFE
jgi:peroxiredoxin